jgi:endonuclease III
MPPKQRQIRIEQRAGLAAMQQLESRSDEELERETRHKAAAMAILGARAADRYDAKAARSYFQRALAASRPQERMQLKRMADASLALAERRAGDLKQAVEKLGHEAPSGRQLFMLQLMGLVAPPASAGALARLRGVTLGILLVVAMLALGFGIVYGIGQAAGGISIASAVFLGLLLVTAALGVLVVLGRRRQRQAREKAAAARGG